MHQWHSWTVQAIGLGHLQLLREGQTILAPCSFSEGWLNGSHGQSRSASAVACTAQFMSCRCVSPSVETNVACKRHPALQLCHEQVTSPIILLYLSHMPNDYFLFSSLHSTGQSHATNKLLIDAIEFSYLDCCFVCGFHVAFVIVTGWSRIYCFQ